MAGAGCFHCGEPLPTRESFSLPVDGTEQPFCCGGCRAVASTILGAGLVAFYRQRTGPAGSNTTARALEEVLADAQRLGAAATAAAAAREARETALITGDISSKPREAEASAAGVTVETDLAIEGMHCGACVWLIEQGLQGEPGVTRAGVNLATERAVVRWSPQQTTLTRLLEIVARLGYRARPYDARTRERDLGAQTRRSLQRLFVAGLGMMQVMMYALPGYLSGADGIEHEYQQLLRWAAFVLTTPVILYSAWPFFSGAWQGLRIGRIGIDVPVSVGLLAAYLASVHATVTASGEVYFDSVAMFTFLLLLARHLQWLIRRRALAQLDAVGAATPDAVWRRTADNRELVAPDLLEPEDFIDIETGGMVPVDAKLYGGTTTIDQSILTGESVPVQLHAGEVVAAGSLVTGPPATLQVLRRIDESAVSRIESMVARGLTEKPRWSLLADRVATGFVLAVLFMTVSVWFVWMQIDPVRAWPIAMTVLIVSCPCALSLATPSAIGAVTGSLMRDGILVTRGDAIEALANATDVVFDKTGTLTEGRPSLSGIDTAAAITPELALQLAAILESDVAHPFAQALRREATAGVPQAVPGTVQVIDHRAGQGVAARWQPLAMSESAGTIARAPVTTLDAVLTPHPSAPHPSYDLRLGSAAWCGLDEAARECWPANPAASEVFLVTGKASSNASPEFAVAELLARFSLTDPVRATAGAAVAILQARGLEVHLLSGDRLDVVAGVAASLGVDRFGGGALPQAKQAAVRDMQAEGRRVLMVGDGLNDAPVLSLADVSIAIGQASDLARTAADVILLAPDPLNVASLHERALRTRRIIGQNLAWSVVYNMTAIPLAAFGWVPPWAAAIGMAASSWLVVANAARLWPMRSRGARREPDATRQPVHDKQVAATARA